MNQNEFHKLLTKHLNEAESELKAIKEGIADAKKQLARWQEAERYMTWQKRVIEDLVDKFIDLMVEDDEGWEPLEDVLADSEMSLMGGER